MSEWRKDRTGGGWVIITPSRGSRPQMPEDDSAAASRPRFDPSCPFCPGHEAELPGIIDEVASPESPGWRLRVVPNKFAAVQAVPPSVPAAPGHATRPGRGAHEVIIESPRHDATLAGMTADELSAVVALYRARMRALLEVEYIAAAILFRNYGQRAGASLAHPHAQVIALDIVPAKLAALDTWARRYHAEHGRCPLCDELDSEIAEGTRVVEVNDDFVALVPFAAEHPFELWLVPRRHQAAFDALSDDALPAFAALLGRSLRRLKAALGDRPYNFVIDSAPKGERDAPHWHWRLRIVPDVATWGGFELGAGVPINPSSPEDDARLLRAANPGS